MRGRRRSEPVLVRALLSRVLGDLDLEASARVLCIAERWGEAVGPEIACHSRPLVLRGDVLEVGVESSVWCQQLQLRTPEILAGLRRTFGEEAPSKLRLRVD